MADTPFAAVGITKQPRGREEEPAPAPHPQVGVVAVNGTKDAFDLVAVRVEPELSAWVSVTRSRNARGEKPPAIATALSTLILGT